MKLLQLPFFIFLISHVCLFGQTLLMPTTNMGDYSLKVEGLQGVSQGCVLMTTFSHIGDPGASQPDEQYWVTEAGGSIKVRLTITNHTSEFLHDVEVSFRQKTVLNDSIPIPVNGTIVLDVILDPLSVGELSNHIFYIWMKPVSYSFFGRTWADPRSYISGPQASSFPILGSITSPRLPTLIVHDPPGDQSIATFQIGRQFCREIKDTYTTANGVSAAAAVSVGIAGAGGIIVTQDFEFSTTFSAEFKHKTEKISQNSTRQCIENIATYTTSDLGSGIGDEADLFIGQEQGYFYGLASRYSYIGCGMVLDTGLVLAPDTNGITTYVWEASDIIAELESLQHVINNTALTDRARLGAQNQIDIYNQVLILNDQNKANASSQIGDPFSITGGPEIIREVKTQTTEITQLDINIAYEFGTGIELVAQVGATGFGGAVNYGMTRNLGESEALQGDSSKLIKFLLKDDDAGDKIDLVMYEDPSFGTPIFKSQSTSKSSCPYELGQRRDKPRIQSSFVQCDDKTTYFDAVPYGSQAATNKIFNLEICNDGDIDGDRTFSLGVTNNLNNAKVIALGTELNNTNSMANITVNMQQCTTISVTFQRDPQAALPGNAGYLRSKDIYDNVILTLAPACDGNTEGDEADVHALFVTFGDPSNYVDETCFLENIKYTFDNLTYGPMVGKDGWVDIHTAHDENIIYSNFSANYNNSKAMSGEGWLVRPNDNNWGFDTIETNDVITLEMDVYMNAYSIDNTSNSVYLQSDLDNNGSYIVNETRFGMRVEYNNNNTIVPQIYINDGRNYIVGTSIPWTTNGYIRFQLVLDPVTNIMTMSYKDLTNNGSWITISSLQNVVLFSTPGGVSTTAFYAINGISVWHIGEECLTDNISVSIEKICSSDNVVTSTADSGFGSLRNVIGCAPSGATITFAPELDSLPIQLTSGQINIYQDIVIQGNGAGVTIIDGSQDSGSRLFELIVGADVSFRDLSLESGGGSSANYGGAILADDGNPNLTLTNCELKNNQTISFFGGGAIFISQGTIKAVNCIFDGNKSAGLAGAINVENGYLSVQQCLFINNESALSGACIVGGNKLEVINCTMTNNITQSGQSVIFDQGSVETILFNNIIYGNLGAPATLPGAVGLNAENNLVDIPGAIVVGINGNFIGDPLFVNGGAGDYSLQDTSLAMDAGDAALLPTDSCDIDNDLDFTETIEWDLNGAPRVISCEVDLGAYENQVECNVRDTDMDGIVDTADLCPDEKDTALHFDGDYDHVQVPHDVALNVGAGDFTLQAWVYPTPTANIFQTILCKGTGLDMETDYIFTLLSIGSMNAVSFYFENDGHNVTSTFVPSNAWSHVAVTYNATTKLVSFYIDGVASETVTFINAPTSSDTGPLFIGQQGSNFLDANFEGRLDDVAIWNRAFTQVEVSESMSYPLTGTESGLIAHYNMNDGFACGDNSTYTNVMDNSPNAFNGTLINFDLTSICPTVWSSGRNLDSDGDGIGDACDDYGHCPDDLANLNALSGNENTFIKYETSGLLESQQHIMAPADVRYDSGLEISLLSGFEVNVGAVFHAYIDGCGNQ